MTEFVKMCIAAFWRIRGPHKLVNLILGYRIELAFHDSKEAVRRTDCGAALWPPAPAVTQLAADGAGFKAAAIAAAIKPSSNCA
jgi:hypothetical protein